MKNADLGRFFVRAPLYRAETIEGAQIVKMPAMWGIEAPQEVQRECPNPKCETTTQWQMKAGPMPHPYVIWGGLDDALYVCKNCGREVFRVYLDLREVEEKGHDRPLPGRPRPLIAKVGQYPRPEVSLPKDFEKALGNNVGLYRKGLTSRHQGYGIGAHAYFRRVVEDTIDNMLDVLERAMTETGTDQTAITRLRGARAGKGFNEKVKLAAEAIPDHLKPGGMNPFADLHDLLSIGLHGLTDDECCDIVDSMDDALKYVYTRLKAQADESANYKQAAAKLHQTATKLRQRNERL